MARPAVFLMRVLVTGCGRSGTQHTAKLLAWLGISTGHEKVCKHDSFDLGDKWNEVTEARWGSRQAESSWWAVPVLNWLPSDVAVWHQLRHPLKVITCWSQHRLLTSEGDVHRFVSSALPNLGPSGCGDDVERSALYWLEWNRMAAAWGQRHPDRYVRYQIEKLNSEHLRQWLQSHLSVDLLESKIEKVMAMIPPGVGSCHHDPSKDVTWEQVEALPFGSELRQQAAEWGYS